MNITEFTLLEQLRISDRDIKRRQELLDFNEEDIKTLLSYKPFISEEVDAIVDEFYTGQIAVEEIARLIGDAVTLGRLKKHMKKYILDLFDGEYGSEYVQSRLRIGMVHKRIGVTPKYYVSAIRNLQFLLEKYILQNAESLQIETTGEGLNCLKKLIMFDLELVFDTYIHSLMEEIKRSNEDLENYAQSLEETINKRTKELQSLARKDSLTGLFNQKSFYEELKRELSRSQRNGERTILVYFDLDHFKSVNDDFGHKEGDKILLTVAKAIEKTIRNTDIGARYGGDEFCIILPQTSSKEADEICRRLIESFSEEPNIGSVTISIGVAESNAENLLDADALVKLADKAMYKSKKHEGHFVTFGNGNPA